MSQPAPARPKRPAVVQFSSTILALEAFVVLFATLVAHGLRVAPLGAVWAVGGGLTVLLVLLGRAVRSRAGRIAGSAAQVGVLATGLWVPTMFVVGGLFALLWVVALRLGTRIDRERAEREAAG